MKITYLFHSGFLVETAGCTYIFDYYKGELPPLRPGLPVVVLASHGHGDHYNRDIFALLHRQNAECTQAVISRDIAGGRIPSHISSLRVGARKEYMLEEGQRLLTLRSTDEGVAFLLEEPEGVIYHAGDLNDWVWAGESTSYNRDMTRRFREEIDYLRDWLDKKNIKHIDAAFLPLDPRQETDYDKGILYALDRLTIRQVYPMHYWEQPGVISRFRTEHPEYRSVIQDTEEISVIRRIKNEF